jgi:hypothetical protein
LVISLALSLAATASAAYFILSAISFSTAAAVFWGVPGFHGRILVSCGDLRLTFDVLDDAHFDGEMFLSALRMPPTRLAQMTSAAAAWEWLGLSWATREGESGHESEVIVPQRLLRVAAVTGLLLPVVLWVSRRCGRAASKLGRLVEKPDA